MRVSRVIMIVMKEVVLLTSSAAMVTVWLVTMTGKILA